MSEWGNEYIMQRAIQTPSVSFLLIAQLRLGCWVLGLESEMLCFHIFHHDQSWQWILCSNLNCYFIKKHLWSKRQEKTQTFMMQFNTNDAASVWIRHRHCCITIAMCIDFSWSKHSKSNISTTITTSTTVAGPSSIQFFIVFPESKRDNDRMMSKCWRYESCCDSINLLQSCSLHSSPNVCVLLWILSVCWVWGG